MVLTHWVGLLPDKKKYTTVEKNVPSLTMENWFGWCPSGVDRIARDLDVDPVRLSPACTKTRLQNKTKSGLECSKKSRGGKGWGSSSSFSPLGPQRESHRREDFGSKNKRVGALQHVKSEADVCLLASLSHRGRVGKGGLSLFWCWVWGTENNARRRRCSV